MPLIQDQESFGEKISFLWLVKIRKKTQVTCATDLEVGEIKNTNTHTGQCSLVRRLFKAGESKFQFYISAMYTNLKDDKKAKTVLDFIET